MHVLLMCSDSIFGHIDNRPYHRSYITSICQFCQFSVANNFFATISLQVEPRKLKKKNTFVVNELISFILNIL